MNVLYHWTHRKNLRSILRTGLDPRRSQGAADLVWACTDRRIGWALGHVAAKHGWPPDDMVLLEIDRDAGEWARTAWDNVFITPVVVPAANITRVRCGHTEDWTRITASVASPDATGRV